MVRDEIEASHADPSTARTRAAPRIRRAPSEVEYSAEDFIVDEDNIALLSRDGWVKRQKEVKDLATTRLREGDAVMAVVAGSTRATAVFFTNYGTAYTCRIIDVPASTGYGEPIQQPVQVQGRRARRRRLQPRSAAGRARSAP